MLKIYNTLKRKKEKFEPLYANKINFYVCGITVYDFCHVGHARTNISMDIIIRYLRFKGFEVRYVRNITDIDDKIIKRANENNEKTELLAERFIQAMHEDFAALNMLAPDYEPRATEYINKIILLIEKIIGKQHAYIAENGDVYFDVRNYPEYGELSQHNIEQLESGARVEINDVKRDPLDFVLWKMAKPGEPSWESPWGRGRPGWHIECSAMAIDLLGEHFDVHAGGRDLLFPHHENEIAQAKAATGKPFANVWMHAGLLQIEKEKMSKSLGNFITIREALQDNTPEVLRYVLLSSHYRSPLSYSNDLLNQAKLSLTRFYTALRFLPSAQAEENSMYATNFIKAMDDDFNTPLALAVLFELAHEIQRLREIDITRAAKHGALLRKLADVLGILQYDAELFFQTGKVDVTKILELIAAREKARLEKNWAEADRIRLQLKEMSIVLEDSAAGTTWKYI